MLIIGIDPDLEASGVAIVRNGQIDSLSTMAFFDLLEFIHLNQANAVFAVEDVELNKALYARHHGKNQRVRERINQNVGQVKAVARLIEQYLIRIDAAYTMVAPFKKRFKKAKDDKEYFNRLTGWTGNSNADKRDAALIALYGIKSGQYVPRPSEVTPLSRGPKNLHMPARLKRACRYSGCAGTTTHRSGYCEKHQPTESSWSPWQRKKGSSSQRGYGSDWRKLRSMILERDNHLCQEHLKQGVIKAGHHVDHIVPKAQKGTDEPSNLQTLCHSCHAHKTATERQQGKGGGR